MLSKNNIKHINSLKIKKYRQELRQFIVEGEKSVDELLRSPISTLSVFALPGWLEQNASILRKHKPEVHEITADELKKISDLTTPNQVLAIAQIPQYPDLELKDFEEMILALDGIRDPGNMGTILRTADWFGIRKIVCSPDCVDIFNTKVIQATMGSFARVNVYNLSLIPFLETRPSSIPVFGALLEGPPLTGKKFSQPGILLIGSESHGISKALIPFISDPVFIPPFTPFESGSDRAESLNASVANAIICYEIRKQLFQNKF